MRVSYSALFAMNRLSDFGPSHAIQRALPNDPMCEHCGCRESQHAPVDGDYDTLHGWSACARRCLMSGCSCGNFSEEGL
jgi:hypothetical protein